MNYYPNIWCSRRASTPPDRFDSLLVMQCLMGRADYEMYIAEEFSANDSDQWQKVMEQELLIVKKIETWNLVFLPRD